MAERGLLQLLGEFVGIGRGRRRVGLVHSDQLDGGLGFLAATSVLVFCSTFGLGRLTNRCI